ncbi:type I restriction-modification system subunit M [Streptomyces cellulosae]|uniref:site-specific DNA-methyltransferase (adenine-specific) n=1 Tax=Streptomyces althioticus TaxID=83380 RepID=A0ABZ1YFM1_9ACTN|nr:type I restriction-modification system subunit M [Streptomyces cellulosae]WTB93423.1 type I restriction-modification system subunit M [Streptomyces cellulosae]WTC60814.1 type I restriction-modification system subunit M [Streptomyces cellulosae]
MPLSLSQLERHLLAAADGLRGPLSPHEYQDYLLPLLFLKHASDEFDATRTRLLAAATAQGSSAQQAAAIADSPDAHEQAGSLYVPPAARWERIAASTDDIAKSCLSPALAAMAAAHPQLRDAFTRLDFTRLGGRHAAHADRRLRSLIDHFSTVPLHKAALAYPDMIGAAYETLLGNFASASAGGEYFTPAAVARLMAELARPAPDAHVYDPCVGSGGMLIQTVQYVAEHFGDAGKLTLAGQDANPRATVMAAMNLLLHGARRFDLRTGDTLAEPQHGSTFDLVLSNPPFSMDYSRAALADAAARMPYGMAPERGRADWMFVQHMLHAVRDRGGSVVTVLPHGALFRDGAEAEIRGALLDADVIEAVIGLPAALFTNTSVPACILVLRSPGTKRPELRGRVLVINADREFRAERSRNVMLPEHVARVVAAFHTAADAAGFARAVERRELADNGDNLNIRRYVDNSPAPEPQDVRAHLYGGMPRAEVAAHHELLDAYGLTALDLFAERPDAPDSDYLDFLPEGERPTVERIDALAAPREAALLAAFATWWEETAAAVDGLAGGDRAGAGQVGVVRETMLASLLNHLGPIGPLDQHALAGAFAAWWHASRPDVSSLVHNGYAGLIDGWLQDVRGRLEPVLDPKTAKWRRPSAAERRAAYAHPVVRALIPEFAAELRDADEAVSAAAGPDAAGESTASRALLRAARARVTQMEAEVCPPPDELPGGSCLERERRDVGARGGDRELVRGVLRDRLQAEIEQRLRLRRGQLHDRYRMWEEKYADSLADVEAASTAASAKMWSLMEEMGYAD